MAATISMSFCQQSLGFSRDGKVQVTRERVANLDEIDAFRLQFINRIFRVVRVGDRTHQWRYTEGQRALQDWSRYAHSRTSDYSDRRFVSKRKNVFDSRSR